MQISIVLRDFYNPRTEKQLLHSSETNFRKEAKRTWWGRGAKLTCVYSATGIDGGRVGGVYHPWQSHSWP